MTEKEVSTLPKSRTKQLAKVAASSGAAIAHYRYMELESYGPCMDAIKTFSTYGKGSALIDSPQVSKKGQPINPFLVFNRRINARCQLQSADDPLATREQRLARANMLFQAERIYTDGINNQEERDEIKARISAVLDEEAARFGLGTKSATRKTRKSA